MNKDAISTTGSLCCINGLCSVFGLENAKVKYKILRVNTVEDGQIFYGLEEGWFLIHKEFCEEVIRQSNGGAFHPFYVTEVVQAQGNNNKDNYALHFEETWGNNQ